MRYPGASVYVILAYGLAWATLAINTIRGACTSNIDVSSMSLQHCHIDEQPEN